ncbi:protein phosphatase 1 regulatory subunit 12A-like isoform X1 [Mya arenaria]|uniref:protein phosphatase 1 regulatory subunit 12A-like isoform X1 n=2 Tax=Mya arenaria TaxID=6604 RepID=UPI0022E20C22|nr:protein phosphatase 1 regulatory subunit 12A-like isoform X1 [Mya arenaria]
MDIIDRLLNSPRWSPYGMADIMSPADLSTMDAIDDPEAIFDFITVRSMQERYGKTESPRARLGRHDTSAYQNDAIYQNEAEFETFVQQFPIDDSIAECFAAANEDSEKLDGKYLSGGKRPQLTAKYNKFKKRFGRKPSDDTSLLSDEEIRSRDSKRRSKKAGGVFSKRYKWRNFAVTGTKKNSVSPDKRDKFQTDFADEVFLPGVQSSSQTRFAPGIVTAEVHHVSSSTSDSQITSFSEMVARAQTSQGNTPVSVGTSNASEDEFAAILQGNTTDTVSKIEDLQLDQVLKMRDYHGNTLLHRSVLLGNADVVKYVLEKFPEMTSDLNSDNETAVEVAAKSGRVECLRVMIERSNRRQSPGPAITNRLLNICAQYGQADCLNLLLMSMSRDPHATCSLPGDARGNTAAHLAAKHGNVQCLHTLVASGYDVTSENLLRQRPLHVAHVSRSAACFEYLLLVNVCGELLTAMREQADVCDRLHEQVSGCRATLEHVRGWLGRQGALVGETDSALRECTQAVVGSVRGIQGRLMAIAETLRPDSHVQEDINRRLGELQGEMERLEDICDFSPLTDMEASVRRLTSGLDESLSSLCDVTSGSKDSEDTSKIVCSLLRDIHRESLLENWDTSHVYEKHLAHEEVDSETTEPFNVVSVLNAATRDNPGKHGRSLVKETNKDAGNHRVEDDDVPDDVLRENGSNTRHDNQLAKANGKKNISDDEHTILKNNKDASQTSEPDGKNRYENANAEKEYNKADNTVSNLESDKENDNENHMDPTERPFTRLLSLDERIDLLIAGEREREKDESADADHRTSSESRDSFQSRQPPSYTSTFTSITSNASSASDWCNRLPLTSLESTTTDDIISTDASRDHTNSESTSYWWDIEDNPYGSHQDLQVRAPLNQDIRRRIHLNLENDSSSYHELRQQRIVNHLKSIQQARFSSDNYRERITTSSGEVMGGFDTPPETDVPSRRVLVDVNGALQKRNQNKPVPKSRKRGKPRLFTLEDAIATKPLSESDFRERFERSLGLNLKWEEMSITTDEEDRSLTWLDHVDNYGSPLSESDTLDSSHEAQSFV